MKDVEEGSGELVVPRGDGPVDFEMPNHALDVVALAIDAPVPTDRGLSIGFWRNAGTDACLVQAGADGVGIISLVSEKIGWLFLRQSGHVFERRAVCGFARREVEDKRDTSGITETMNFTGEPAPRAAKRLFASPPFAPAAET